MNNHRTATFSAAGVGVRLIAAVLLLSSGMVRAQIAPKDAEPATRAAQNDVEKSLETSDREDFDDANYGFLGTIADGKIANAEGRVVWDMNPYDFIKGPAPETVNPSLWHVAKLNGITGLFKVTDRVYQVRGLDSANITIIEGDHSLILIDSLFTAETARAALDLYYQYRPKKPISTLIYSHGHVDHFGGSGGLVSDDDIKSGRVQVIAPTGFMDTAVAENVIAGNAMARRSQYQFGGTLPVGPRGAVDIGCCVSLSTGRVTLVPPTSLITKPDETRTIDGIQLQFHLVPGAEAPAEMFIYLPQFRVLDTAEITLHSMHNLYAIRGAEVRDANAWSHYLNDAIEKYGSGTDILIMQHQWPVRGRERIISFLKKQRDMYKYMNDQALRLINEGYTPDQIAETLRLPPSLENDWAVQGYYGALKQNLKAVYQKYMGWFNGNPADLDPLPTVEAAKKTVEYMGGAPAIISKAREDFTQGQYRWVASVMKQVVYADPGNKAARDLGADALEQLGYQAESGLWRSAYLVGAMELRNGVPKLTNAFKTMTPDTLKAVPTGMYFDILGVRLNPAKANGKHIVLNWNFTDQRQLYALNLENSALTYVQGKKDPAAQATITLTRATLDSITLGRTTFPDAIKAGEIQVTGDIGKFYELQSMLDKFDPSFPMIEPLNRDDKH